MGRNCASVAGITLMVDFSGVVSTGASVVVVVSAAAVVAVVASASSVALSSLVPQAASIIRNATSSARGPLVLVLSIVSLSFASKRELAESELIC
jgi:hypothetical protein